MACLSCPFILRVILADDFRLITIPLATLKAQIEMKCVGFELFFYYSTAIGITVNYKSRGGEWAAPTIGVTA